MIKIEHIEVNGVEAALRGMRNPMNSWDKGDSYWGCDIGKCQSCSGNSGCVTSYNAKGQLYFIGPNDLNLMQRLYKAGSDHRKYMRMITVSMDITAPLYWWKEFDTYKVGTVANSCSTMHKIHAKEFTIDDFSHEHLVGDDDVENGIYELLCYDDGIHAFNPKEWLEISIVDNLNRFRKLYLETNDKKYWWQIIQLLPSSYNQKRTITFNLEVVDNMVKNRKHHKLDEWQEYVGCLENIEIYKMITRGE